MRKILLGLPAFCLLMACGSSEQSAVITVSDETLMHEVRATPSPANGACVKMNPPRFMWPDKFPHLGPVLDGVPGQVDEKPKVVYRIRISQDKNFQKEVLIGERAWAFFNPTPFNACASCSALARLMLTFVAPLSASPGTASAFAEEDACTFSLFTAALPLAGAASAPCTPTAKTRTPAAISAFIPYFMLISPCV